MLDRRLLTAEDKRAGVVSDEWVEVGSAPTAGRLTARVRRVTVRLPDGKPLVLLTNSPDLDARTVALVYRWRWQVELFFKWFKCVLGCGGHWASRSESGLTIQVYVALLASMLLNLWTGVRPNKATFQMICLYFQGWASEQELRSTPPQRPSQRQAGGRDKQPRQHRDTNPEQYWRPMHLAPPSHRPAGPTTRARRRTTSLSAVSLRR